VVPFVKTVFEHKEDKTQLFKKPCGVTVSDTPVQVFESRAIGESAPDCQT
jgi:hypothetical protein